MPADLLEELESDVKAQTDDLETIDVEAVRAELRDDTAEGRSVVVTVVLGDPPRGQATWAVEELRRIRSFVRESVLKARAREEIGSDYPWFVVFEPVDIKPLSDDETVEV
jgi:hypothetical protein